MINSTLALNEMNALNYGGLLLGIVLIVVGIGVVGVASWKKPTDYLAALIWGTGLALVVISLW